MKNIKENVENSKVPLGREANFSRVNKKGAMSFADLNLVWNFNDIGKGNNVKHKCNTHQKE